MAKISIFGVITNIQMLLQTALRGKFVGQDDSGNKYYRAAPRRGSNRERRWVIFRGAPEATLVPPEWHGWLHHQVAAPPAESSRYRKPWQKPPQPNLTGTDSAYLPPGHTLKGGRRDGATADYIPWQPPQ
jgi:NADH:ubiquinone oxidoreductase subunit